MKVWQETEFSTHLFYDDRDGKIIGMVHKLGTQSLVYLAKVFHDNVEVVLGQFVNGDYAKKAVEYHWLVEERTLINHFES